jgi:hypothetical protein
MDNTVLDDREPIDGVEHMIDRPPSPVPTRSGRISKPPGMYPKASLQTQRANISKSVIINVTKVSPMEPIESIELHHKVKSVTIDKEPMKINIFVLNKSITSIQ